MQWKRFIDYYKVLQVDPEADSEVIEAAYRKLARKYHPDVRGSPADEEKMKVINEAWSTLSDPARRARHDAERREAMRPGEVDARGFWRGPSKSLAARILVKAALVALIVLAVRLNPRFGGILAAIIIIVWLLRRK